MFTRHEDQARNYFLRHVYASQFKGFSILGPFWDHFDTILGPVVVVPVEKCAKLRFGLGLGVPNPCSTHPISGDSVCPIAEDPIICLTVDTLFLMLLLLIGNKN